MPFNDFDVFWRAAKALVQGSDPYALPGVYYPLPTFFLFIPFVAVPLPWARGIWTVIEFLIFVTVLRQRALFVVLFMPVFLAFLMGQTVIPLLGVFVLLRSGLYGGLAMALLMLKPQLVIFVMPWLLWRWWQTDRQQIAWFGLTVMGMAIVAFAVQPDWISRWLAVSGERVRAPISPSVWGVLSFLPAPLWIVSAGLVTVGAFIWAWHKSNLDLLVAVGMLVNPILISYDLTFLTVMIRSWYFGLAMTLLSWFCFAMSAWQLNERAFVLVTLAVIFRLLKQVPRRDG